MWPERLLQVARNIRGMIDDSGTAAFYQLAQLCEIHDLEDLERYDGQYRNVLKSLCESSRSLLDVAVNLSTPHGDELLSSVEDARSGIENISSTLEATHPISTLLDQPQDGGKDALFCSLPSFDFVPMARVSDIGMLASRLTLAVEEEAIEDATKLLEKLEEPLSAFQRIWDWRRPENFYTFSVGGFPVDLGVSDLELGLHLTRLRAFVREGKADYLRELAMLAHATIEEMRGGVATISLTEFYDRLSSVSLFMDVRMKDVTLCLAELLERGWIGGVEKRRGREVIRLRQPQLEHIQGNLRGKMGSSDVTVEGAMEEMDLEYFTAYHIVKRLERDGELVLEEGVSGDRRWRWGK